MYLSHFALHNWGNAGDTVLTQATRDVFDKVLGPNYWDHVFIDRTLPGDIVEHINTEIDAVVFGGGGLLNPGPPGQNRQSGFLCILTLEQLRRIEKPIIVFGIGYNRYRGQQEFNDVFKPFINELVRKSIFFGMRNYGSIASLLPYLDSELREKVSYQPCPSTLIRYLYPEYDNDDVREGELALNVAMDASEYRYGDRKDEIFTAIAKAMKWANGEGWTVNFAAHRDGMNPDIDASYWLDKEEVKYNFIDLYKMPPKVILDFYKAMPLTLGMRGHGVMIPFGMGNPFIGLVSHDKLPWFLSDISSPAWGIEVNEPNLSEAIIRTMEWVIKNDTMTGTIQRHLEHVREMFWQLTVNNLEQIGKVLSG